MSVVFRMAKYKYAINCVLSSAKPINEMVNSALEITYNTFMRNVCYDDVKSLFSSYAWGSEKGNGLRLKDDWAVSYYRSKFRGMRCYYIDHSSIEYVFLEDPLKAFGYAIPS